jgi:hypothetical protein
MAFAPSKIFNSGSSFQPFESPESFRKRFSPDTKLGIAIGGWGDTAGFSESVKDDASMERYAKNVAAMLKSNGFDGVGELHHKYYSPLKQRTNTLTQISTGNTPVATARTTNRSPTPRRSARSKPTPSSSLPSARPLATTRSYPLPPQPVRRISLPSPRNRDLRSSSRLTISMS